MNKVVFSVVALCFVETVSAAIVVDFEGLPVNAEGFYNGDVAAGSPFRDNYTVLRTEPDPFGGSLPVYIQEWETNRIRFSNSFNENYSTWSGWSWSSVVDASTAGFGNQYASYPGGGSDGMGGTVAGGTYAIAFGAGSYINLPAGAVLSSIDVTNSTYAALTMLNGDQFSKQFGGPTGNDPDLFQVTFTAYDGVDGLGNSLGAVTVDLADYRFADNSQDFILDSWETVDLTSLADARSLSISFFSTDVGDFGINTPTYVAVDNLTLAVIPEPGGAWLLGLAGLALVSGRRRRLQTLHV